MHEVPRGAVLNVGKPEKRVADLIYDQVGGVAMMLVSIAPVRERGLVFQCASIRPRSILTAPVQLLPIRSCPLGKGFVLLGPLSHF